jgi:carnosine N-methyltransferase
VRRSSRLSRSLSPHLRRALLSSQPGHFAAARAAAATNAAFLADMLATYESPHVPEHLRVPPPPRRGAPAPCVTLAEAEKARASPHARLAFRSLLHASRRARRAHAHSDAHARMRVRRAQVRYVLRNLSRDWSAEGAAEREESYGPLLAALARRLPVPPPPAAPPRVLVPGAGLGRLCVEAAARGYVTEGNECSYYMLLMSSYIMNHAGAVGDDAPPDCIIHPWALNSCNNVTGADALRPVMVPDLRAGSIADRIAPGGLGMAAGDFCDVYGEARMAASYDAVLTCFFLDTSHNVLATIDILAAALRTGGLWINTGPLLYHWADAHTYLPAGELSIEVPLEEVKAAAAAAGFEVLEEGWAECGYADNVKSMMRTRYRCATWTMVKRDKPPAAA